MKSGIYIIESSINGKKYVGSAVDCGRRITDHKRFLKNKVHYNLKLQNHVNKYGLDDLKFYRFLECEKNMLLIHEQHFIDTLKPVFNICLIAGNIMGTKIIVSQETREKMSLARKGKPRGYKVKVYKGSDNKGAKQVIRISENGDFKLYTSLSAADQDGFTYQNIGIAIRKGYKYRSYYWVFV